MLINLILLKQIMLLWHQHYQGLKVDGLNHLCILLAREQSHCKIPWQHAKIKSEYVGKERIFLGVVREGGVNSELQIY